MCRKRLVDLSDMFEKDGEGWRDIPMSWPCDESPHGQAWNQQKPKIVVLERESAIQEQLRTVFYIMSVQMRLEA